MTKMPQWPYRLVVYVALWLPCGSPPFQQLQAQPIRSDAHQVPDEQVWAYLCSISDAAHAARLYAGCGVPVVACAVVAAQTCIYADLS